MYCLMPISVILIFCFNVYAMSGGASNLMPGFKMNFRFPKDRSTTNETDRTCNHDFNALSEAAQRRDPGTKLVPPKLLNAHATKNRRRSMQRRHRSVRRSGDIKSPKTAQEDTNESEEEAEHHSFEKKTMNPDQKRIHTIQEGLKVYLTAKHLDMRKAEQEESYHRNELLNAVDPIYWAVKGSPTEISQKAKTTFSNFYKVLQERERPLILAKAKQWDSWQQIHPMKNINAALKKHVGDMFPKGLPLIGSPWDFYVSEVTRLLDAYAKEAKERIFAANNFISTHEAFERTFFPPHNFLTRLGSDAEGAMAWRVNSMEMMLQTTLSSLEATRKMQKEAYHSTNYLGHLRKGGRLFYELLNDAQGDHLQDRKRTTMKDMARAKEVETKMREAKDLRPPDKASKSQKDLFRRLLAGRTYLERHVFPAAPWRIVLQDDTLGARRPIRKT